MKPDSADAHNTTQVAAYRCWAACMKGTPEEPDRRRFAETCRNCSCKRVSPGFPRTKMNRHISDVLGTPPRADCHRRQLDGGTSHMTAASIPTVADLETWSKHAWTDGLQVDALQDLETVCVRTRNSTYEITVLSGRTAEVLVRGGQFFPEYTSARVAGSSLGGSFLKLHGIYLGFSMELQHDGQTIVTTAVQSISRVADDKIQ